MQQKVEEVPRYFVFIAVSQCGMFQAKVMHSKWNLCKLNGLKLVRFHRKRSPTHHETIIKPCPSVTKMNRQTSLFLRASTTNDRGQKCDSFISSVFKRDVKPDPKPDWISLPSPELHSDQEFKSNLGLFYGL